MTVELKPEQIPEVFLNTLIQTATKIIKDTPNTYAYVRVPADKGAYLLWIGLNENSTLEECYFYSEDVCTAPMNSRPSGGSRFLSNQ